jgi:hypothetical protein
LPVRSASQLADPALGNAQQDGGIAHRELRGEATQELGSVTGYLSGGAFLVATAGTQMASPLVEVRVASTVGSTSRSRLAAVMSQNGADTEGQPAGEPGAQRLGGGHRLETR